MNVLKSMFYFRETTSTKVVNDDDGLEDQN